MAEGRNRVGMILAGGEGVRLLALTSKIMGRPTPKQFCPLAGAQSLLEQTRRRLTLSVSADRTLTVLTRVHEEFYRSHVACVPDEQLVVQPQSRGTAPAILLAAFRALRFGRNAAVSIFPSDHYVDEDAIFMSFVERAFRIVELRPELTVLLGITPERPEPNYGWIEPAHSITVDGFHLFGVRRFWEKPPLPVAKRLMAAGAFCNTFVMIAQISALLELILVAKPKLYAGFASVHGAEGTALAPSRIEDLYAELEPVDFSSDILVRAPSNLVVLPVSGVAWTDLGEPERVMETIGRMGPRAPRWAAQ